MLLEDAKITPLPIDEEAFSLSAILLDEDYYLFLKSDNVIIDEISVLTPMQLIPFKAKVWLDLSARKEAREQEDSKNINKHKNDIFRLTALLTAENKIMLPDTIKSDLVSFLEAMKTEDVALEQIGIKG